MVTLADPAKTRPMDLSSHAEPFGPPLARAHEHAVRWLESLDNRPVRAASGPEAVAEALGRLLPEHATPAEQVIDRLAMACEPGLVAMPSGRFFGFVIGGSQPAALAADWLVAAWDQNTALRQVTPAAAAVEEVASAWVLELLGLPATSGVGFVTGATMANFTALAAARDSMLRMNGRDPAEGLAGAPAIRVVAGGERHESVDLALRYLGLPAPVLVAVDEQGRIRPDALERVLDDAPGTPTILVLQAGNLHSGAFDPFEACVAMAHDRAAWVHVDGAFGLWAGASPARRHLTAGLDLADSWATDAHKTLNVPYDCGVVAVRDPSALEAAMGMQTDYLIHDEAGDPMNRVPELSRRGRAIPVWAALRASGRQGVAAMVERMCGHALTFADAVAGLPGAEVLNDVVFTQVCVSFGDDRRTRQVVERVLADGTAWMSGSRWRGRAVLRIAVSNAGTTDQDVRRSVEALERATEA